MSGVLVLGLGNELRGDDGAGPRVVDLLSGRDLPAGVRLEAPGAPGWGLPALLAGWRRVILVDAAQMGLRPGTWRRFGAEAMRGLARRPVDQGQGGSLSLHEPGVAEGVALAQAAGVMPETLVLYGVEPEACGWERGLSPAVERALPGLVDEIMAEIREASR